MNSSKYGVIVHSADPDVVDWVLSKTGAEWYLRFDAVSDTTPSGKNRLLHVEVGPGQSLLTQSEIEIATTNSPGAIWYVSAEPNVRTSVESVVEDLNYYYTEIKAQDPSARITSPAVLNWQYTCVGCGGYESGQSWMTTLVERYEELYSLTVPWDIWAIDLYPIDWWNLPNTGFTTETIRQYAPHYPPDTQSIAAQQLQQFRLYIDSISGQSNAPIIVTELGIHWGWTELKFTPNCTVGAPSGEYKPLVIKDYLNSIYTWLETNAEAYNIERWFTYNTYSDVNNCRTDGYAGFSLLDRAEVGSELTDIGRWYVERSSP